MKEGHSDLHNCSGWVLSCKICVMLGPDYVHVSIGRLQPSVPTLQCCYTRTLESLALNSEFCTSACCCLFCFSFSYIILYFIVHRGEQSEWVYQYSKIFKYEKYLGYHRLILWLSVLSIKSKIKIVELSWNFLLCPCSQFDITNHGHSDIARGLFF